MRWGKDGSDTWRRGKESKGQIKPPHAPHTLTFPQFWFDPEAKALEEWLIPVDLAEDTGGCCWCCCCCAAWVGW